MQRISHSCPSKCTQICRFVGYYAAHLGLTDANISPALEAVYPTDLSKTSPTNPSQNSNKDNVDSSEGLRTSTHEGGGFGDIYQDGGRETPLTQLGTPSCSADSVSAGGGYSFCSVPIANILPVPDAIQRIHPLSPTESSNAPSANLSQILKEGNVNPSGNSTWPNNEGMGRSASIVAPDVPQLAADQGVDGQRTAKRRWIEDTSQETQLSHNGVISSSS
jgi:hypothetical protein